MKHEAGFHFPVSKSTSKQLINTEINDMVSTMEKTAPTTWSLLSALLSADPMCNYKWAWDSQNASLQKSGQWRKRVEDDDLGNDIDDANYWNHVDPLTLGDNVNELQDVAMQWADGLIKIICTTVFVKVIN